MSNVHSQILLVVTGLLFGCDAQQQLSRQIPTFANLKNMSLTIQRVVDEQSSISSAEAARIIGKINMGLDAWGNPVIFKARQDSEFSFVLISLGRDGRLDVDHVDQYFTYPQEDIVGKFDRDIVFRDGKPVTLASNK